MNESYGRAINGYYLKVPPSKTNYDKIKLNNNSNNSNYSNNTNNTYNITNSTNITNNSIFKKSPFDEKTFLNDDIIINGCIDGSIHFWRKDDKRPFTLIYPSKNRIEKINKFDFKIGEEKRSRLLISSFNSVKIWDIDTKTIVFETRVYRY